MIYGRKFFDRGLERPVAKVQPNPFKFVHKAFQLKYTLFLCSMVGFSILLFVVPVWYFLNQNYEIFSRIAFDTHVDLIEHLERELVWLAIFAFLAATVVLSFSVFIGMRLTAMMIGPLIRMEKHMRIVTLGDWSSHDFRIREHDDYRGIFETYSYLYRSLRAQTQSELKLLEKLSIDPNNREALAIWQNLVDSKKRQLNTHTGAASMPIAAVASKSDEVAVRRHAS